MRCNDLRRTALALLLGGAAVHSAADTPPAEEMIVTATRVARPLRDHPGSITRLAAQDITERAATHHSEIMNRAAGTMIQRGSGQESLTAIRSPVLTGPGSCGAFLILEDGIPIRPTGLCNVNDLFEINSEQADAIEIVRGPGSALYGSSAMHGTVNVLFEDAAARPGLRSSVEGGSDDYLRLRADLAHAPDDPQTGADWRLLGHWTHDGGFRADSGFEEAKLNALFARQLADGILRLRLAGTNLNQETAGFIQGFEAYRDPQLRRSNVNPEAYRDARSARMTAHWQSGSGAPEPGSSPPRSSQPGTSTADISNPGSSPAGAPSRMDVRVAVRSSRMDFLQHFLLGKPLERNGQDSASLYWSMARGYEATQLTLGVDVEGARSFLLEMQDGPTTDGTPAQQAIRPAGRHYDFDVDSFSAAAYAQVEHALTAKLRLNAGLRVERVRYDYDNRMLAGNTDENGVPCALGGCLYSRPADRTDDFTNVAPKLALIWSWSPRHRLYVNAGRGFRAPETSELYRLQRQQSVAALDSERIDSVELGARGRAGTFDYALAAFALDKQHVILRDANAFNVSDGRTSHRGVEYEIGWSPLPVVRASASGTLARHRYEFDRSAEAGEQITDGNDVDTAPRQVHSVRLQWQPVPALGAELEWLKVGRYFVDASNGNRYAGHELLNVALRWRFLGSWHAAARINNVLDTAYADRADFAFGNYRYFPGRDRTAFLEIGYALQ